MLRERHPRTNRCLGSKLAYMPFYSNEEKVCLRQDGSRYTVVTNSLQTSLVETTLFLGHINIHHQSAGGSALGHHWTRLIEQLPSLLLPVTLLEGKESSRSHSGN